MTSKEEFLACMRDFDQRAVQRNLSDKQVEAFKKICFSNSLCKNTAKFLSESVQRRMLNPWYFTKEIYRLFTSMLYYLAALVLAILGLTVCVVTTPIMLTSSTVTSIVNSLRIAAARKEFEKGKVE